MAGAGSRQQLFLHIGLPKSGTTFLQELLAGSRDRLEQAGFIYPFVRPEAMFHAAVEVREQHQVWGLAGATIDGTWDELVRRVRDSGRTGLISHEILAGAVGTQLDRVAAATGGLDLHVVVTARDLARQATAHWQEEVKNGRTWSFAEFEEELFGPGESEEQELGFWRSQDLASVLRRWSALAPPDRTHVVVVPRRGTDRLELWRRYCEAVGLDPTLVGPDLPPMRNESLGSAQVALLRQVVEALDGRLGQPHYAHVVKRFFAQGQLSAIDSPRPVAPERLRARLDGISAPWAEEIRSRGYRVHGDLDDLRSEVGPEGGPHPDEVTAEQELDGLPDVIAALLLEIAALRGRIDGPKGLPPLGRTDAQEQRPEPAPPRRRARLLGRRTP